MLDAECEAAREALSASLDDESAPLAPGWLTQHVVGCSDCRGWYAAAVELRRRTRLSIAPPVPDLSAVILASAARAPDGPAKRERRRLARGLVSRLGLLVVAVLQLWVSLPVLLFARDHDAPTHPAHELGAFGVALACGLLYAAWRPESARGMRPLVGAVACLLVATAVVDLLDARTTYADEAPHLISVAAFIALTAVARRHRLPPAAQSAHPKAHRWARLYRLPQGTPADGPQRGRATGGLGSVVRGQYGRSA